MDRNPKVFCSHRSVDKPRVEEIARTLRARGIDAWLDTWEIVPGDSIVGKINKGLDSAEAILLFLSKDTLDSKWVTAEANTATWEKTEGNKRVIPVMLDPDAPVPPLLRDVARVQAHEIDRLIAAILGITGKPPLGSLTAPAPERTVRLTLRSTGPGMIAVLPAIDGHPGLPEQEGALGHDFAFPNARQSRAEAAVEIREAELARLGHAVGQAVFPGPIATALASLLDRGEPLLLAFETADPKLLSIPFEAARLPDGRVPTLQPGVRVLRRHTAATPRPVRPLPAPLRILVAIGAPDEGKTKGTVLDIENELQTILDAVDAARRHGATAEVEILEVGHPKQIRTALEAQSFHVLHLSGHGSAGKIEMENEDGEPVDVTPRELADVLRAAGQTPPLVVLSSCHGGVSGTDTASFAQGLLEQGVPLVLAMQSTVSDWYGTRLAGALYSHLCLKNVNLPSHALSLARQEVESERREALRQGRQILPEYATPSLFCAGDESPLLDWNALPVDPPRKTPPPVTGPVPLLKIGELIGRREELRQVLRILRDDPRAIAKHGRKTGVVLQGLGGVGKSALAGRAMSRLAEDDWKLVAVEGRWTLGELATRVGASLITDKDETTQKVATALLQPTLPDEARLQLLAQLLASQAILLVLDNFEDNLTLGGGAFLDASIGPVLATLYNAAHRGKILVTCRYPVPESESWLVSIPLGPLSPAQTRKLFHRLAELKGQPPEVLSKILRLIGGHPRMLEYLDAILRKGTGRLSIVEDKLRENVKRLGVRVEDLGGDLEQSLQDAIRVGAQDIFLDELLDVVLDDSQDREVLGQASVFPMPIDLRGLAMALSDNQKPAPELIEQVREAAARLVRTSLLVPIEEDSVWIHRWTAEALKERKGFDHLEHCRRAGEFLFWRVRTISHSIVDGIEGVRLLLQARAFDRATEEAVGIYKFMSAYGQPAAIAAFMGEILKALPEDHSQYALYMVTEADALWVLGNTEGAVNQTERASEILERIGDLRGLSVSYSKLGNFLRALGQGEQAKNFYEQSLLIIERLARDEPNRADYQRDLSVSYNKLGDLLRDLGQGEQAKNFYEQDLAIAERLARDEPNRADYQRDLSVSYNKLGDLLRDLGQGEQAKNFYEQALLIRERLARDEPKRADYQRDLSVSYEKMGDLLKDLGQGEQAKTFYEKALLIREQLARDEPKRADYQRDLSISYERLGDLLRDLGQGEQAKNFYEQSLLIRERLARDEPNRAGYQTDLVVSLARVAEFDSDNGAALLRRALLILKGLKERGVLLPTFEPWIGVVQEMLDAVESPGTE